MKTHPKEGRRRGFTLKRVAPGLRPKEGSPLHHHFPIRQRPGDTGAVPPRPLALKRADLHWGLNEHAACTYLERYIIVSGSEYTNEDSAKTVEMYDTGNNRWERLSDMITPRWGHGSCTAGEKLYVFCGRFVGEGAKELNSIEVLNLRTREDGFIEF